MHGVLATKIKKDNNLTQTSWDRLLAELDADRERAAATYEQLRQTLITFFEIHGSRDPYRDTDETINRVARRLSEGQLITASNPASYFYAVARNVWRERLAERQTETVLDENLPPKTSPDPNPLDMLELKEDQRVFEERLALLKECLQELSIEDRELITAYYQGEGRAKIAARRELAARLDISGSALRIRACRIRSKLEDKVNRCLRAKEKRTQCNGN